MTVLAAGGNEDAATGSLLWRLLPPAARELPAEPTAANSTYEPHLWVNVSRSG